mgnify:CR=1 FL=1
MHSAVVPLLLFLAPLSLSLGAGDRFGSAEPDVWYGPRFSTINGTTAPDLFPLLTTPASAWPQLAARTSHLKLFLDVLYQPDAPGLPPGHGSTDDQLRATIAMLTQQNISTALEIGGGYSVVVVVVVHVSHCCCFGKTDGSVMSVAYLYADEHFLVVPKVFVS